MSSKFIELTKAYKAIYDNNVEFIEEYFRKNPTEINEPRTVKEVSEGGTQIDYVFTPLMFACRVRAKLETVKKLVELGADVNQEVDNVSPLSLAVEFGNLELVKYLYEEKNANLIYGEGYSVVVDAIGYKQDEIADYFINKRLLLDYPSGPGHATPLVMASAIGRADYVKNLMDVGANDTIRDATNCTPLMAALIFGEPDIADLIMSYKRRTPLEYGYEIVDVIDQLLAYKTNEDVAKAKEYLDRYRMLYLQAKVDKLCQQSTQKLS